MQRAQEAGVDFAGSLIADCGDAFTELGYRTRRRIPMNALSSLWDRLYLMPTTMESGPTRCSMRVSLKPASRIQPWQSAPV